MKLLSLRTILLFYSLFSLSIFSQAETKKDPNSTRAIIIGIPNVEPLAWHDDQVAKGQFVLLAKEAFSRIHVDLKFAPETPFPRSLIELEDGKIDALIPMFISEERKQKFIFPSKEMASGRMSFFIIKGKKFNFDGDFSKLKDASIGSLAGSTPGLGNAEFEKAIVEKRVAIQTFRDFTQGIKMLKMDRFNAICGNRAIISHIAKKSNVEVTEITPSIIDPKFYIMFSKKRDYTDLISKLEKAFTQMEKDGTTAKILKSFDQ